MKVLAIIPARSGSKGVRNKNIRRFNGKPLLAYSIEAALQSSDVDRVIVSTDSEEIKKIAVRYGADVPFLRPKRMAHSTSQVRDAVIHLLDALRTKEDYVPDVIMLLQPTSPLRNARDIAGALALFKRRKADSLVSMCRTENLLLTKGKDDALTILNTEFLSSANRQELQEVYRLDGSMIYIVRTDIFLQEQSFFAGKLVGYEIPRWRAVDIDEPQDFVVGEVIARHEKAIRDKLARFT